MHGFTTGKTGVLSSSRNVSVARKGTRLGDCPEGHGCPAGWRMVFGQCVPDVPSGTFAPIGGPVLMGSKSFGRRW